MRRKVIPWMILVLFICNFFIFSAFAENYPAKIPISGTLVPTAFDQRFVNFMRRWRIPGASVTIMKNNSLLFTRGYGYADLTTRTPVTPESLFRIGSVSKAITAVTVLKLIQDGKLHLDDSVYKVLGDLRPLDHSHNPNVYQISVRHLLQMTTGWQTDVLDPMFGPWSSRMLNQLNDSNGLLPPDCHVAARMMMAVPFRYRPGTQFSYSNIGYCLLGMLANKVTGNPYSYKTYENYVQQNILNPIGVYNMRIGDTLEQNRAPNEVSYYSNGDVSTNPHDMVTTMAKVDGLPYSNSQILKKNYSDGGWIASSMDLAKFLQAVSNHQILTARTVDMMLGRPGYAFVRTKNRQEIPASSYFAMGWSVKRLDNRLYWYKTGSFTGTYAVIIQRDDGTSYAAVFNTKPYQRTTFLSQLRRLLVTAT